MQHAEELENKAVESSGAAVSGEHEIEIDTDLSAPTSKTGSNANTGGKQGDAVAARAPALNSAVVNATVSKSAVANGRTNGRVDAARDDDTFELSDDEIEPADPSDRPSLVPGSGRRPPPLPSTRPRSLGSSTLPPPARPSAMLWASNQAAINAKNRISALEQELADVRWQLANRTLELTRTKARCGELESALVVRDRQIAALERRLTEAEAVGVPSSVVVDVSEPAISLPTASAAETPSPAAVSSVPSTQPSRAERSRELPSSPSTVPSAAISSVIKSEANEPGAATEASSVDETPLPDDADELFTPTPSPADVEARWREGSDELSRISGINPGIAESLRAQGVSRLSQIAAWSDDDVRRIAKAIKVPKSRISRGRWVQKAREALAVASNAKLSRDDEAPASTSNV